METSLLNPNAPLFISSLHKSVLAIPPLPSPHQNPNFSFPYPPVYFMGTIYSAYPLPHCLPYNYSIYHHEGSASTHVYNFPHPPLFEPAVPPPPPTCIIRDLDDSTGTETSNSEDQEPVMPPAVNNRRRVWAQKSVQPVDRVIKYSAQRHRPIVGVSHKLHEISGDVHSEFHGNTTLMIKNLPNRFCKAKLICILRDHCKEENEKARAVEGDRAVLSEIDYFYLPIDFSTQSNFGYCFVNFTTSVGAWRLYKYLHNHNWTSVGSHKKCEVNFARIQGLAACTSNADRMYFRRFIPDAFLPVHFEPPLNGTNQPGEFTHGMIL